MMTIEFVKGHCGWDVVTLCPEGQVPPERELGCAMKILGSPLDGGLELGWLGAGERPDEIRVRMVSSTAKDWIPMCGGMTQVIGKALFETFLRDRFKVDTSSPFLTRTLLTEAGAIPIRIASKAGRVIAVTTIMDRYLSYSYRSGVETLDLNGIPLLRVGDYAVLDVEVLEAQYPHMDFTRRDPGPHLDLINDILRAFGQRMGMKGVTGMLYDRRPEGPGGYRVFPRFYSHDLAAARIPWEFQCGTGSIAVVMALAHERRLPCRSGTGAVLFEWGSYRTTKDPYGIRTSRIDFELEGPRLYKAAFSHSVVEILAVGTLALPAY